MPGHSRSDGDLGHRRPRRADHGRDPDTVVRRAADGQPRDLGDRGADPGDPVEVAEGVLRQPATQRRTCTSTGTAASPVASARSASDQATSSSSVACSATS